MTENSKIPHDDFSEGFRVGWQAVYGIEVAVPNIPEPSNTPPGMTPFLAGLRAAVTGAGGKLP
jgi:hypothetical protein